MFDTVVLLTGSVEEGPLTAALLRHNPHLAVLSATTLKDLDAIAPRRLKRIRLLAFATPVIVPARILNRLGFGAYNFHPGPPHYPGWRPAYFAAYDRTTTFGVTAHVMYEKVDSGPIIAVDLFDVPAGISAESLEAMAYVRLVRLFFALAEPLACSPEAPPTLPVQWCGRKNTRRHYAELCNMQPGMSPDELARRMAVFGDGPLGIAPPIALSGCQSGGEGIKAAAAASAAHLAAIDAEGPIKA